MPSVFERYAPFVQDFIYAHRWEKLRSVQVAAGDAVFNSGNHILLCASTASGKTEAAFFPILTELSENPPMSVGALYIAPLKALINDQFERLTDLCAEGGIPVWAWHGDISQTRKKKLIESPSGILQITPESLEALLLRKHAVVPRLFCDLRFIVIDEIHSLMRGDRGGQTMCLIERLARLSGSDPRRIGLSATIGDPERAAAFLKGSSKRGVVIPKFEQPPVKWRLAVEHFFVAPDHTSEKRSKSSAGDYAPPLVDSLDALDPPKPAGSAGVPQAAAADAAPSTGTVPPWEASSDQAAAAGAGPDGLTEEECAHADLELDPAEDKAPAKADQGLGYIFEHSKNRKCLVFSNSREECEAVTSELREYCLRRGEPERFLIHHGNLSTPLRLEAEALMKEEDRMLTVCTTATLELGIDIGRLERAFQINAPFTVSAFLQRMGRTGRRGTPPEMRFVIREDEPESRAMLPAQLPWELIHAVGLIETWREDHWVEPPRTERLPFSLLYHQTMSILASSGELTPAELARRVLTLSPFRRITPEDYKTLLLHLLDIDHIQRTERRGLIVGLAGERAISSFKFYAVFQENEEYSVRADGQELGTLVQPPPAGEKIAIAGRVWEVEEVDVKRHIVWCRLTQGRVPAFFGLCPGDIHTHILEKACEVLRSEKDYPYLMPKAKRRLAQARSLAMHSGLVDSPLVELGGGFWALFPWLGTYPFLALERLIKIHAAKAIGLTNFETSRPWFIVFRMRVQAADFFRALADAVKAADDPMSYLYPDELPVFEKYDEYVPPELIRKGFAHGVLGIDEMRARVLSWAGEFRAGSPGSGMRTTGRRLLRTLVFERQSSLDKQRPESPPSAGFR